MKLILSIITLTIIAFTLFIWNLNNKDASNTLNKGPKPVANESFKLNSNKNQKQTKPNQIKLPLHRLKETKIVKTEPLKNKRRISTAGIPAEELEYIKEQWDTAKKDFLENELELSEKEINHFNMKVKEFNRAYQIEKDNLFNKIKSNPQKTAEIYKKHKENLLNLSEKFDSQMIESFGSESLEQYKILRSEHNSFLGIKYGEHSSPYQYSIF